MRKGMTEEKIFLAFLFLSPAVTPFPRHSSGILSVRKVRGLSRKRSKKSKKSVDGRALGTTLVPSHLGPVWLGAFRK